MTAPLSEPIEATLQVVRAFDALGVVYALGGSLRTAGVRALRTGRVA